MTAEPVPDALYKYTTRVGIACLQSLQIKVTPPYQLNDPFEFYPRVPSEYSDDELQAYLAFKENRQFVWRVLANKVPFWFHKPFDEFERLLVPNESTIISYMRAHWPYWSKGAVRNMLKRLNQELGLYCMSNKQSDQLMWSHYSESHKGLVIGLNPELLPGGILLKVKYSEKRALLNPVSLVSGYNQQVTDFVTTKSTDWSYEDEYRLLVNLSDCERVELHDNGLLYLCPVAPKFIEAVILGARIDLETVKAVLVELSRSTFHHVRLEQASADPEAFRIVTEAVTLAQLERALSTPTDEDVRVFPWLRPEVGGTSSTALA